MNEFSMNLERARLLLQQGRTADAKKELKQVLSQDPDNDTALSLYGQCLLEEKKTDEAISVFQQAISKDPEHGYYFYLMGFAYYQKDDHKQAIEHLGTAIQLEPYQAEFYGLLSHIYIAQRKYELALEKADEGLAVDPENITALNARSIALNKLRRTDDAVETMQTTLSMDPDNAITHTTVGWNLLEKGRHKEAMNHFREALRIDPGMHPAKSGLKEALKSVIPPYRWLLQFSFWVHNKGKNFRWGFFIAIYIGVRIVVSMTRNDPDFEMIGIIVAAAYLLFIGVSWIISPMANAFLLFHRDGKHALEPSEKWNAIAFMACIGAGILVMILSSSMAPEGQSDTWFLAGMVLLSLSVPAGHMDYPLRLKGNSLGQWLSMGMLLLAVVIVGMCLGGLPGYEVPMVIYFIAFVLYSWVK
ncbi:MAG TPA: tetratricopeptide repeat protein [Chitinophagaceae bacterium]|nr:tetratricopeptide repeat protein [Chitinophagaceae bacterium]